MKQRNIVTFLLLSIVTLGIYALVWVWQTANEMKEKGADIPSPILIIVPIANIYFLWKYSGGVEKVTNGKLSQVISFLLFLALGLIGMLVIQDAFNKVPSSADGVIDA